MLLDYHNVHGKDVRIHETLEYRATDRALVRTCRIARQRLWGLLPPKETETVTALEVPASVTTEDALWGFIRENRFWRRNM